MDGITGRLQADRALLSHSLSCFTGETALAPSLFPAHPDFSIGVDVCVVKLVRLWHRHLHLPRPQEVHVWAHSTPV